MCQNIPTRVNAAMKKSPPDRFDALCGLTYCLQTYDIWMMGTEFWEPGSHQEKSIKSLAKAWKALLKFSDAELGIDSAFTRPGTIALLQNFGARLARYDIKITFNWRP